MNAGRAARRTVIGLGALVLLALAAGQMGAFGGSAPTNLGVRDGRLAAPSTTPNSVSSQAALWPGREQAAIAPLPASGDAPTSIARIRTVVESMSGARVVDAKPDYLRVEFKTLLMRFSDDAEFWYDPAAQVVHVRSASRLGRSDWGVNRKRVEEIRGRLGGG